MDAPFWEIIVRIATALVAMFAFSSMYIWWSHHRRLGNPMQWVTLYMTVVLGVLVLNRVYVLWIGLQHDADGTYGTTVEPVLRAMGAALLLLMMLGIGFMSIVAVRGRVTYE
jgi:uncharacterized membrane-anchored protein